MEHPFKLEVSRLEFIKEIQGNLQKIRQVVIMLNNIDQRNRYLHQMSRWAIQIRRQIALEIEDLEYRTLLLDHLTMEETPFLEAFDEMSKVKIATTPEEHLAVQKNASKLFAYLTAKLIRLYMDEIYQDKLVTNHAHIHECRYERHYVDIENFELGCMIASRVVDMVSVFHHILFNDTDSLWLLSDCTTGRLNEIISRK